MNIAVTLKDGSVAAFEDSRGTAYIGFKAPVHRWHDAEMDVDGSLAIRLLTITFDRWYGTGFEEETLVTVRVFEAGEWASLAKASDMDDQPQASVAKIRKEIADPRRRWSSPESDRSRLTELAQRGRRRKARERGTD